MFLTLYHVLIYMYLSKEPWKDKGFNDFYQKLWYYQGVTFKPDQTEKELPAKKCGGLSLQLNQDILGIWVSCWYKPLWQIIFVLSILNLNISNPFHFCHNLIFKRIPNGTPMLSSTFRFFFIWNSIFLEAKTFADLE